ncbi:MAG TPA: holo-ACP synthase [Defluviitaleaceae bacterium]|jgi:holo-[acyl-carrier protein] synthase|nr:holo-ACP synthase [Defluviitaleaceae bacterium]HPT75596.1 holo-ACP synthase [Defluviitaleaceae bacterium]HQD51511.1 holo-ACP synthase [Defluviitaleaceae bacterium]
MVIGIGTDIIEIKRIEEAVKKNSNFMKKCFTAREQELFESKKNNLHTIAGTFAAKEAVSKALGTGFAKFELKDIEIVRDEKGKPCVLLHNKAKEIMEQLMISEILLTISHSREYAIAYALAQN